jgi:intracellular sulfur oxidation DsrE/DsrF family protein
MNRRLLLQAGALAISTPFLIAAHAQSTGATGQKRYKIVIQVSDNDPAKWNLALNNAKNLQEDVGAANVDIELVAYGPGIGMLKLEAPVASRIGDARRAGVRFLACENTMRGQKLTKDDMNPDVAYVPAGVTEIMTKQSEGWAYLRP